MSGIHGEPTPAEEIDVIHECLEDTRPQTFEKHHIKGLQIYTDGNTIDGWVGDALTCWRDGRDIRSRKFKLAEFCSVFQAEMYALLRSTDIAIKHTEEDVSILSDSRSFRNC